jgi:TRAP-type C4-dicarboxylate transport system permease small subunit
VLEWVTIGLLGVIVVTTLVGVADRFVLGLGLPWPEELSRFLLVWTSLLAAAVAAKQRKHFQVMIVIERLGRAGELLVGGLCLLGLGVILGYGVQLVWVFHGQRAPALGIPMSWVYVAVPVSAVLIAWYVALDLIRILRGATPRAE